MQGLQPGQTVGVIGGGQLGRMLAMEARKMNIRVCVLDRGRDCPAAQVAEDHIDASLTDKKALLELAKRCSSITLDTEHVPAELLKQLEHFVPVRPSASIFETVQDRLLQKDFISSQGIPLARYAAVGNLKELEAAIERIGLPAILKTRREGYDGKGQMRIQAKSECAAAWEKIGAKPAVLEAVVLFEREISVLLARDTFGVVAHYPIAENEHRRHILHLTRVPARISKETEAIALGYARQLAVSFAHIGMMAVEMFVLADGRVLINEIAPRTHNSGHYTYGACLTSQFEQHLRAVCGLPLGDPAMLSGGAVMLNLLGDLWINGTPRWENVLQYPCAKLHLYGKKEARPGRKMGHILFLNQEPESAAKLAEELLVQLPA